MVSKIHNDKQVKNESRIIDDQIRVHYTPLYMFSEWVGEGTKLLPSKLCYTFINKSLVIWQSIYWTKVSTMVVRLFLVIGNRKLDNVQHTHTHTHAHSAFKTIVLIGKLEFIVLYTYCIVLLHWWLSTFSRHFLWLIWYNGYWRVTQCVRLSHFIGDNHVRVMLLETTNIWLTPYDSKKHYLCVCVPLACQWRG